MTAVLDMIYALLLTVFVVGVGVAVVAIRDCLDRGDAQIREAIRQQEQWEAARNVTGRISR